jgi:hypothetical protein
MKTTIQLLTAILIFILISHNTFSQSCIYCESNTIADSSSAIGAENISTGKYSLAAGFQNEASGDYSSAFGYQSLASGEYSFAGGESSIASQKWAFAFGERASATGFRSFAQGMDVNAMGTNSVVIGRFANTYTGNAMVIGYGVDNVNTLNNTISNSLMIGFNSNLPTLFISMASGQGTTGNVGIATTDPTARLEVNGTMKVNNWAYMQTIVLDDSDIKNIDELQGQDGLKFKGKTLQTETQMILTENGDLGIGVIEPTTKLEVNGKIKSSGENSALILQSPDGTEWEITIDNSGNLSASVLTAISETIEHQEINIYPNPAKNNVTIDLSSTIVTETNIELYDLSGKMVFMKQYKSKLIDLDLEGYDSGAYILKIKDQKDSLVKTEKIIIE